MILKYLVFNTIRKIPNKLLIVFFAWVVIGSFSYRFKILKSYYEFNVKEVNKKMKLIFEITCKH